jgi:hypothetical protein
MTTSIATPFYFHSNKESNREEFDDLFPAATGNARDVAVGVGYEIEFEGEWHDNGEYWATGIKTEHGNIIFSAKFKL